MRGLILVAVAMLAVCTLMGCQPNDCCAQTAELDGFFTPADAPESSPTTPAADACTAGYCRPVDLSREMALKRYYGLPVRRGPIRRMFCCLICRR